MGRLQTRTKLHNRLVEICPTVYFQPPANISMKYPCIVYERDRDSPQFADNVKYRNTQRYQVTIIDRDPDSELPEKVSQLPLCTFDRFYVADGINHDVYSLFS